MNAFAQVSCLAVAVVITSTSSIAQDTPKPIELAIIKSYVGVWDAEIEAWPSGLDAPSIKFKGVETNRAYGEYWIASDFDSTFQGQETKVHAIVGFDRDQQKLVGTVIDHGPYDAKMTGTYDAEAKSIHWLTQARDHEGNKILQKTTVTQTGSNERFLVLSIPVKDTDHFTKCMEIKYVKRE